MLETEGLLVKTGVFQGKEASSAKSVLGFDYIVRHEGSCIKYYAANPPLVGITRPEEIDCPLGARTIGAYKVDYKEAVDIFLKSNCGGAFTGISLSWPLVPSVTEPQWHIRSVSGEVFVIGANSGAGDCLAA